MFSIFQSATGEISGGDFSTTDYLDGSEYDILQQADLTISGGVFSGEFFLGSEVMLTLLGLGLGLDLARDVAWGTLSGLPREGTPFDGRGFNASEFECLTIINQTRAMPLPATVWLLLSGFAAMDAWRRASGRGVAAGRTQREEARIRTSFELLNPRRASAAPRSAPASA